MTNNQNNKDLDKNYQRKNKQNQINTNNYSAFDQETSAEITKPNQNLQNINNNTQQYYYQDKQYNNEYQQFNKQYQQEAGNDFLGNQTGKNRSGNIMPDLNEESGIGMNADKYSKANKNDIKKKQS